MYKILITKYYLYNNLARNDIVGQFCEIMLYKMQCIL